MRYSASATPARAAQRRERLLGIALVEQPHRPATRRRGTELTRQAVEKAHGWRPAAAGAGGIHGSRIPSEAISARPSRYADRRLPTLMSAVTGIPGDTEICSSA